MVQCICYKCRKSFFKIISFQFSKTINYLGASLSDKGRQTSEHLPAAGRFKSRLSGKMRKNLLWVFPFFVFLFYSAILLVEENNITLSIRVIPNKYNITSLI
jgi:hypothetical protein